MKDLIHNSKYFEIKLTYRDLYILKIIILVQQMEEN